MTDNPKSVAHYLEARVAIVAGVDFGTLSVRVSIFDDKRGRLGAGTAEYGLNRSKQDPDFATQKHDDHMAALVAATRRALEASAVDGREVAAIALDTTGSSVIPVGAQPRASRRLLSLVRPPRLEGGRRDHLEGTRGWPAGHRLVRGRVLVGVGLLEAAPLAAPQPGQTRSVRDRLRALRHGRGDPVRDHRSGRGSAQRVRDGPQVDVEPVAWRPAARIVPRVGRPAPRRGSRHSARPLRHLRSHCRPARARMGRAARALGGNPDPDRGVRRALGRNRRRRPSRRRRQRDRHLNLHHRLERSRHPRPRRVRRRTGVGPPEADRRRGGPVRDRRHLRRHRETRGQLGRRDVRAHRQVPRGRDRPAPAHMGQRRPDRAGEPGTWRRHARAGT